MTKFIPYYIGQQKTFIRAFKVFIFVWLGKFTLLFFPLHLIRLLRKHGECCYCCLS